MICDLAADSCRCPRNVGYWDILARVQEEVARIDHPYVIVTPEGEILKVPEHEFWACSYKKGLPLATGDFRKRTNCRICFSQSNRRFTRWGRWEVFCMSCRALYGIDRIREFLVQYPVSKGVKRVFEEFGSYGPDEVNSRLDKVWIFDPTTVGIANGAPRIYIPEIPERSFASRRRFVYREDKRYYYIRCCECRRIMKIPKREYQASPGSRIAIERRHHCQTCPICGNHDYVAFERRRVKPYETEAP